MSTTTLTSYDDLLARIDEERNKFATLVQEYAQELAEDMDDYFSVDYDAVTY